MTLFASALAFTLLSPKPELNIEAFPDLVLHDKNRDKDLHVRVTYPEGKNTCPVIIFSHGLGGNKDLMQPLIQPWAKAGYIVIQPTHADSKVFQQRGAFTKTLKELQGNPLDRPKDIKLILDNFDTIEGKIPGFKKRMNRKAIAMAGHSYGAWTTMAIGGLYTNSRAGTVASMEDSRPICLLPISPQGIKSETNDNVFSKISRPTFSISGTEDVTRFDSESLATDRRMLFDNQPSGDKFLLWIDGADHTFGGISGARANKTKNDAIFDLVVRATTEFFNAFLKKDPVAVQKFNDAEFKTDNSPSFEFLRK